MMPRAGSPRDATNWRGTPRNRHPPAAALNTNELLTKILSDIVRIVILRKSICLTKANAGL
jgi:hypothetical protein